MYLFCKENTLIESYSINKLKPKVGLTDFLNPETITNNYNKLLHDERSGKIFSQLYKAFVTDEVLNFT